MSNRTEPYVSCDGWDDVAILVCERPECLTTINVGYPFNTTRRIQWVAEIDHLTPEQVVAVRDKHLEEMH